MPPTIKLQRKRDSWEKKIKIAYAHVASLKNNFNIYKNESTRIKERYKEWLKKNDMDPLINFDDYK